jgi:hypothetical protein
MWVGNIPAGVSIHDLETVFNNCPVGGMPDGEADGQVLSIYILDYTKCCFVNFRTEYALRRAISRFHNVSLHPEDPSVLRLVCRVRTEDDALKAGVNSQRGKGIHLKWVWDKTRKMNVSVMLSKCHHYLSYSLLGPALKIRCFILYCYRLARSTASWER